MKEISGNYGETPHRANCSLSFPIRKGESALLGTRLRLALPCRRRAWKVLDQRGGVESGACGIWAGRNQIFTLNCSPFLSDCTKAAINCGIISKSFRLTTSTGECM